MKIALTISIVLAAAGVFAAQPPASQQLSDSALVAIKFDQKLNNQVSLDLSFHDENGKSVQLANYFGRRPVVLILGYYECPMLCSLVLNGAIEAMQDLKLDAGKDFEVVNVSVDPRETPALAAGKKRVYIKRYGRPGAAEGWHFLTGNDAAIRKLTDEVGFRYAYDPEAKQFAHPSGLVILTPDGKVSHYIFGVTFSPTELDAALRDAQVKKIGSPIEQFVLLCFHYSPITGKYGKLIMTLVRVSGVATAGALGFVAFRRGRKPEVRK
jgi:protein SCO1/2